MTERVAAIVLAAGKSTRMGPQTNKLLEPISGKPLLAWPIEAAIAAQISPIILVTGFEAKRIEDAFADRPVEFVHNPHFASGMASSIAAGFSDLAARDAKTQPDGALILLGDLPGLRKESILRIRDTFEALRPPNDPHQAIVAPRSEGRRGHPVLFGRAYFEALSELASSDDSPDEGARTLIERHSDHVHWVEIESPSIHRDIDSPEELRRERERTSSAD